MYSDTGLSTVGSCGRDEEGLSLVAARWSSRVLKVAGTHQGFLTPCLGC